MIYIFDRINLDNTDSGRVIAPTGYSMLDWKIPNPGMANYIQICWKEEAPPPPPTTLPNELIAPLAEAFKRWVSRHMG